MDLSEIRHIEARDIADFQPDVYITTLTHESRCTAISRQLEQVSCRKILLVPKKVHRGFSTSKNLKYFEEEGFEQYSSLDEHPDLQKLLPSIKGANFRLFLDCTGMPPTWNHTFFTWFGDMSGIFKTATLRLAHAQSAYDAHIRPRKFKRIDNFTHSEAKGAENKKNALILGMGHEGSICKEIISCLKPDQLFLLYADPAVDTRFVEDTFIRNSDLIEANSIRRMRNYSYSNGKECYQLLVDLVLPLRDRFNVQIIPHGPKVLSLATLWLHQAYPDIHISYPIFKSRHHEDRTAAGIPLITDLFFECDE